MGKIKGKYINKAPAFRKIALGSWKTAGDPSVYGLVELDVTDLEKRMAEVSSKVGVKLTMTHVVGKVISHCINRRPEINGFLRGSRIFLRDSIRLFFQVNIPGTGDRVGKANLSGVAISDTAEMSIVELAKNMEEKVQLVRSNRDPELSKNLSLFDRLPWWLSRPYLNLASWLIYGLNLNLKFLGIPKDPFGSVMITNVGSMGIDQAWAPLVPYSRVPLLLTIGKASERPWAVNGEVKIRKTIRIGITFDHRFIDGSHAAAMGADFEKCFKDFNEHLFKNL